MVEIVCQNCGKKFNVKPSKFNTTKYCSRACKIEAESAKVTLTCQFCGKEFKTTKCCCNRKYCSIDCYNADRNSQVIKTCETCGKQFFVTKARENTAHFCSRACADTSKRATSDSICPICGSLFHYKPYHMKHYGKSLGNFCSRECLNKAKKEAYLCENNHQYGLRGHLNSSYKGNEIITQNHNLIETMVYMPNHPYASKSGRVKKHRLVVEQYYERFNCDYFVVIEGKHYLKPSIEVHHIDGNHSNNSIENLLPCTKSEHRRYHKTIITQRDSNGRIIKSKTAVFKWEELLGSPEMGNQQPSFSLTTDEGSETNS